MIEFSLFLVAGQYDIAMDRLWICLLELEICNWFNILWIGGLNNPTVEKNFDTYMDLITLTSLLSG